MIQNNEEETNIQSDENIKINNNTNNKETDQKRKFREEVKSSFGIKRYRIQEVIKPGQVILVQVIKRRERSKRSSINNFYFFSWKIYGVNA